MLSINTNISSLIAQSSMKTSSQLLNQAVERMTTGFKINHAKDNAANYSISTNMTTKIGAYMVAEDNVLSGMDLINTATEVIQMMEDRASRLSALSIQARNGTYGAQSLAALNAEAGALVSEITRLYNSTQFNEVNLFNRTSSSIDENLPQAGSSGFIEEPISTFAMRATTTSPPTAKAEYGGFIEDPKTYTDQQVADMKTITQAISESSLVSGGEYSISTKDELVALADYVNAGNDTTGMTFVLGADIDLSSITNWTPIGDYTDTNNYCFKGTFNGNGYKIKSLTMTTGINYRGLFGCVSSGEIKNLGIEGGNLEGGWSGSAGLIAKSDNSNINNCYTNLTVSGRTVVGGLIGYSSNSNINNCYSLGNVNSSIGDCGGLIGYANNSTMVSNSFSKSTVSAAESYIGGLIGVGHSDSDITNCYATGNVSGKARVGGLVGSNTFNITNCFATGNVTGTSDYIGGLVGYSSDADITNSYATGNVKSSSSYAGGLVGYFRVGNITNSYATGSATGLEWVGGLAGGVGAGYVVNSYAKGIVNGTKYVGGLAGRTDYGGSISSSYATGNVSGETNVGGLVGDISDTTQEDNFATGNVEGNTNVGGYAGSALLYGAAINSCYSTGNVSGEMFVGGLVGQATRTSYAVTYTQCHSYGTVSGTEGAGGLIGGAVLTTNGTSFGKINLVDCQAVKQNADSIGGVYQYDSATTTYTLLNSYDSSGMVAGVKEFTVTPTRTSLLLGINGNNSDQITFDTNFVFDFSPMNSSVDSEEFSQSVNSFVKQLQEKTTILGAVQNRLESALDEISIKYENLASSRSTIRDADIAEVCSTYIQQQILQQASATLMSTANQSPAIALQLI